MATQHTQHSQQKDKGTMGAGSDMAGAAKDTAGRAVDAVKDAASNLGQKAADAGSYVAQKAGAATSAVGGEMSSLANTIRDKAPHEGMLGNAASSVASGLESCGRELQEHGLSGIADDITNTVRRHPVPAMLIGIGLGFFLARMVSK